MKQLTITDAIAAKNAGMKQVEDNADAIWIASAYTFLLRFCETHETVFCDELWAAGLEHPRESRALGPVMKRAVREGLIKRSGSYRPSVHSNMTPKPVWTSLVFKAA